jgi:glucokinase
MCGGGAPAAERSPMPRSASPLIAGVDIGGTSIKAALVDAALVVDDPERGVLGRSKVATEADEGLDAVIERIGDAVRESCEEGGVELEQVGGIGVAAAGAVDHVEGVVLNAVNLKWEDVALARLIQEDLELPASVENDVRAAVYGEQRAGAAHGRRDVFGVWIGTGVGGGLILSGELFYGSFGTAGEFGRGIVLPWSPPGEGSLEQVCSRTGIAENIARLLRSNRKSVLELPEGEARQIKSKEIARAFEQKDELVTEVVEHSAQVLGVVIGGIVTLLSLECVVLGGGLTDALGKPYVSRVRENVLKTVFPDQVREVSVLQSTLGDDAGPIGAALLAARRLGMRARAAAE